MICDIQSYLIAMHYMLAFNPDPSKLILYWDEPTITMDCETHPLHAVIHKNWVENQIPNIVLSCATLPHEQAPDAETLLLNENASAATTEEEAEEEAEAALSTVDSEFGRTTDPVRMYMREMGTVDLLTREGEIVIAKKIEAGLKDMVMALAACPVTISEILANVE
jgi:hypothetical protein